LWRVYEHDAVGQNFRLPELLAAVGLASAEALPANIQRKTAIHDLYASAFADTGITLQCPNPADKPVWWLNAVVLPPNSPRTAEQIGHAVMAACPDVEVRPAFYPLHWMAPFKAAAQACPNAEDLYRRLFCLPSSAQLTNADVDRIVGAVREQLR
jgi:perosamine synthetase